MFNFSILEIIGYVLAFLIILILKPLFKMSLMKIKYGKKLYMIYYPLLGRVIEFKRGIEKHKDFLHFEKEFPINNPDAKVIVSNTFTGLKYIFFKPDHLKFILQNQDLYRKTTKVLFGEQFISQGLAFQEGEDWKLARTVLSKSFEFDQLAARIPLIKKLCQDKFQQVKENEGIDIINVSSNIVGEVITQSFFSQSFPDINGRTFLTELVDVMVSIISLDRIAPYRIIIRSLIFGVKKTYPQWTLSSTEKALLARLYHIKDILRKSIRERQQMKERPQDFLTAYIQTMEQNSKLTEEHAIQQYIFLIFAGMDTTSNLFGACNYALAKHPEWQQKLREKIQQKYDSYDKLGSQNINSVASLHNFINECMRMYSPVPHFIEREVSKDHKIGDIYLAKNTEITLSILPNNFDPKNYVDPRKFNPDRWITRDNSIDPFLFLPFSMGKRNCIGQHMAIMELKCLLVYLLLNYEVEQAYDPVVWAFKFVYSIQKEKFIKLKKLK